MSIDISLVFKENGKWYFFDETWDYTFGPFDTEKLAMEARKERVKNKQHSPNCFAHCSLCKICLTVDDPNCVCYAR